MTTLEFATTVQALLSLMILTVLLFGLWPAQRIDIFRQQMFAIRDELFDFAASGKIVFDDPAYQLLRHLMNGFIRYAHNITPIRTTASVIRWKLFSRPATEHWTVSWNHAIENVQDENVKKKLQEFHSRVTMLVVGQLVLSPGLLFVALPIFITFALIYRQWTNLRNIYKDVSNQIPMSLLEEEATSTSSGQ
jgi:hypothetical protein